MRGSSRVTSSRSIRLFWSAKLSARFPAIAVPETIDFTKLTNLSELWATASLPVDTYTSAIITMDYTSAQISVMVNGVPTAATVLDPSGAPLTAVTLTVDLDPSNPLILQPTFATSNALRLSFNFDLSASNSIDLTTSPPTVKIKPYFSISTTQPDHKLIRVRGALINSSVVTGTYSVVVRPFFDEVNSLGIDTIFNDANTIYTFGGITYIGTPGLTAISQASAGSTVVAAFTTFEPTTTPAPGVNAGIFHSKYVVAGGTLEDFFTYGVEGDVTARSGNTLTLHGATLFANAAARGAVRAAGLNRAAGTGHARDGRRRFHPGTLELQLDCRRAAHHGARLYSRRPRAELITLDSTGASATDTGSVRIQSTELFGSVLISSAAGSLDMNLQSINNWPVSVYNFAGNGVSAAQDPTPSNFLVNTGSLTLPTFAAGDPVWVDGFVSPFGSAPPDFLAQSVSAEATVPATLVVRLDGYGNHDPFRHAIADRADNRSDQRRFRFGPAARWSGERRHHDLERQPNGGSGRGYDRSNERFAAILAGVFGGAGRITESVVNPIQSFNGFASFVTQLNTTFAVPTPATQFIARGFFDRTSNTFTASIIDVVL